MQSLLKVEAVEGRKQPWCSGEEGQIIIFKEHKNDPFISTCHSKETFAFQWSLEITVFKPLKHQHESLQTSEMPPQTRRNH